ncbi:tRNA 5-methoxyuridine(34)/uridine 5-oxyacetic acid(34) synthase CmoB [Methylotetracoccus oryzae]|uniref:tRNA 5-methoxyuridine(34)/uridine 5-oxyacetic acid(34) synthase CmoB n=1 Tax=Methylotetracoccus oryzae TaxID=1919059 RepID=UPI00111B40AD|nr:tRNA 5-methoxyuridine(34)/uridine 5-oxyacetic acid(34) synthase CmoB [Methylotetracoccus oryzae]
MSEPACWPGLAAIDEPGFPKDWRDTLRTDLEAVFANGRHGRWREWLDTVAELPPASPSALDFTCEAVTIGAPGDIAGPAREQLTTLLQRLHPWRKGPFRLFGIDIDAEWRSNLKWQRLQAAIAPLHGRRILDVGCGNGYYAWRMLGAGAELVVGIDPTLVHIAQFLAVKRYAGTWPVHLLPLGIEQVPPQLQAFDTVFSMGVLYHRRSPLDHLLELKGCLRPGGELVLETLVIDGPEGQSLLPEDRYAQMRNVWFIPSCMTLVGWLRRCGYRNLRVVDVAATTPLEQRATAWMRFQSLTDFLDPHNPSLTCEGLPAPQRAVVLAESP